MSRKLINELTWSVSRDQTFQACRRQYYYQYYGSWEGWLGEAPERTRRIYRLKNLKKLDMWAGSIVHEVIAEALRRYALKKTRITGGELQAHARQKLRQGWLEAVAREWERHPKRNNLFELYYGNGKSLPSEQTERIRHRVNGCLAAFAESAVLQEILSGGYMSWKPVDQLDSFVMDGELKVWCAIDFAFTDPVGNLRILDWKTGAEKEDALRLQLACYACYAQQKWHAPLASQRLAGVFLQEQSRVSEYSLSPEILLEARERILASAADMRAVLRDVTANVAVEDDFPMVTAEWACRRCNYREICPAVQVESGCETCGGGGRLKAEG